MEYRNLELNILSAKDLKNVSLFSKMNVYAVVSITGDPQEKQSAKTPVHRHAGTDPTWNFTANFTVNENLARQNQLTLHIKLRSQRSLFGDKQIGRVQVPLKELLDQPGDGKSLQYVNYQVRKSSGKAQGAISLSYKLGEKFTAAPALAHPPPPIGSTSAPYHAPPPYGYPPPPSYGGYPPPQQGYGYPHPGHPGYGYPPQAGYGYPPVQAPAKKSKFGMGMGAGLLGGALGGLLIGDMISDANAYDSGYDAGFDDAGGFDF